MVFVVDGEQFCAQGGVADAAPGIDARTDQEAQMVGVDRAGEAGGERQGLNAVIVATAGDFEAAHHEGAVEADKGNDIADGGEGDKVEQLEQVRQAGVAALAQGAVDGDHDHEGDAGSAEITEARNIVGAVGVH